MLIGRCGPVSERIRGGGRTLPWPAHLLGQLTEAGLLLLAEQPADGGLDALLLGLLVQGVLAAGHAAQRAGLRLQGGSQPAGSVT